MGEVHGATRNSASADWLVALRLMVRLCDLPVPSRYNFSNMAARRWSREIRGGSGLSPSELQHPVRSGAHPARRVPPLERRNLTLSRAGSFRNEDGVSTLAIGVGVGSNPEALSGNVLAAEGRNLVAESLCPGPQSIERRGYGAVAKVGRGAAE